MEKKMCPRAFWLLLGGISAIMLYTIINAIITMTAGAAEFAAAYTGLGLTDDMIALIEQAFMVGTIIGLVVGLAIYGYFLYRVLLNKKKATKQVYLTVLFVFNVIGLVVNLLSVITTPIALINVAINVAIIVGRVMQKKYDPPVQDEFDNATV